MVRKAAWLSLAFSVAMAAAACSAEMDQDRNQEMFYRTRAKAERGDRVAALHLGTSYRRGIGTAPDPQAALYWYELGGRHGGWAAIGTMYEEGDGVPRDLERALSYYLLSSETGDAVSMYRVGCMHGQRQVAAADPVEGYMWLLLAKTIGDSSGTCLVAHYTCNQWAIKDRPGCRARLRDTLTPEQRAEAERRVAARLATWSRSKR